MRRPRPAIAFTIVLAGGLALLLLGLLIVHTPIVERRVARLLVERLHTDYGIDARIDRLRYNLFALRVELEGVRLAAADNPGLPPFLTAGRLGVVLNRAVLRGDVHLDAVELADAAMFVERGADGRWNLPQPPRKTEATPVDPAARTRIEVGRLELVRVAARFRDALTDTDVSLSDLSIASRAAAPGAALPIDARGTLAVALGERRLDGRLGGALEISGDAVRLAPLVLETTRSRIEARGGLSLGAAAAVDLDWTGAIDLDEVAALAGSPLALDGLVEVEAAVRGPLAAPEMEARLTGDALALAGVAPLDVTAELAGTLDRVRIEALTARRGRAGLSVQGELALDDTGRTALAASWQELHTDELSALIGAWPIDVRSRIGGSARAAGPGLDWRAWRVDARVALAPDGRRPQGAATPSAPPWLPLGGTVALELHEGRWRLDPALDADGLSARGRLHGTLAAGEPFDSTLAGELTVAIVDLARLLALAQVSLPEEPSLAGGVLVDVVLGGRLSDPGARLTVTDRGLVLSPYGAADLAADLRASLDEVRVDALSLALDVGRLEGQARLDLARSSLDGRFQAALPDVGAPLAGLVPARWQPRGAVVVTGELGGTIEVPSLALTVAGRELAVSAQAFDRVEATLTLTSRAVDLDSLDASQRGGGTARASGRYGWTDGAFALDARAEAIDLAPLARELDEPGDTVGKLPLTGRLTAAVRAEGRADDLAGIAAQIDVAALDARLDEVAVSLVRPARLAYTRDHVRVADVEIVTGASRLTVSGVLGTTPASGPLVLSAAIAAADVEGLLQARSPERLALAGRATIDAQVGGTIDRPELSAAVALSDGRAAYGAWPPAADLLLESRLAEGLLVVETVAGRWQDAAVSGAGQLPLHLLGAYLPTQLAEAIPRAPGPARLVLTAAPLTPALIAPFVADLTPDQLDGEAALSIEAEAEALELDRIDATMTLDRLDLRVAGIPVRQVRPARIRLAGGRLDLEDVRIEGPATELALLGGVVLVEGEAVLDLAASGTADLRILSAFVEDMATAGVATVNLRATGAASAPSVDGTIDVAEGELVIRDPRVVVSDLTGRLELSGERITAEGMTGSANGGPLAIDATLEAPGYRGVTGSVSLQGRNIPFEYPRGLRTELDLGLMLSLEPGQARLGGHVIILRGAYREPFTLVGGLRGDLFGTAAAAAGPAAAPALPIALDLTVTSDEDLIVENNYGQLAVGADLRVLGTLDDPGLLGSVVVREGGVLYLGGLDYRVERARADFVDPSHLEPVVDLLTTTRVQGTSIELTATGTPQTLEVTVTAPGDPGLGERELYEMLALGTPVGDEGLFASTAVRDQVLGLLSGDLLNLAGRTVGLDMLRLERGVDVDDFASGRAVLAAETDPSQRLTVAKRFHRDVLLVFSQDLRDSGRLTWIASWQPLADVQLRALSRDDESRSYDFRHELVFGRGERPRSRPRADPREPIVAAVHVLGVDEAWRDRLDRATRLRPGQRFDFYQWMDDRDRLAAALVEAGYFEHRVRADRGAAEEPSDEVVLTYRVDPGPRCELVLSEPLGRTAAEEMRGAWATAVYDPFLVDDLTAIARRHAFEAGFPEARIGVDVGRPDAGTKRATVAVDPGPRLATRLAFHGNRQVSADMLAAAVAERSLERTAWLDAPAFEAAMADWYRAGGFLDAAVRIGDPGRENGALVLPIAVDEGARYRVAEVEVEGARRYDRETVRQWFGVTPGAAYRPLEVEAGRRAVDDAYRRAGFAEAASRLDIAFDRERGDAAVVLAVEEGPQQILQDVVLEGSTRTDRDVIARTLDLHPGQPIALGDLYDARRRLYGTGVFSRIDVALEPAEAATAAPGAQPVRARVEVADAARYLLRYGVAVDDEEEVTGRGRAFTPGLAADLENRNVAGTAAVGGLALRYQRPLQQGRLYLTTPRFFGVPLATTLFGQMSRESRETGDDLGFVSRRTLASIQQTRALPGLSGLELWYGYVFDRERTVIDTLDGQEAFEPVRGSRLTASILLDRRDDDYNPTRGWLHTSNVEYSDSWLLSDFRFVRYHGQLFYFRSIGPVVAASALRFGRVEALGDQDVLSRAKFLLGGANTVRGFGEELFAGLDVIGLPRAGDEQLLFNQEARFPLHRWFSGVAFVDVGRLLFRDPFGVEPAETITGMGTGVGLRVTTPVGLVRVDLGVPVSGADQERSFRLHLSLGHAF